MYYKKIGLHEFYYSSNYILILNIYRPIRVENSRLKTYQEYLPSEVYILDPNYFQKSKIKTGKNEKIFKANKADVSCNTVWHVNYRILLPYKVLYIIYICYMYNMDIIGLKMIVIFSLHKYNKNALMVFAYRLLIYTHCKCHVRSVRRRVCPAMKIFYRH